MNLRPAITGLSPLAERMQADGMSRQLIGSLTTVPLLLFGGMGLWAGWIGRRVGLARAIGLGLLLLAIGCGMRSLTGGGESFWRIAGTVWIGAGIAVGNVLLPGLVKSRYPRHVGLMTSIYATAMNLGAAVGIAFAVPMAIHAAGGWRASLAMWGWFALFSLLLWSPQMRPRPSIKRAGSPLDGVSSLARQRRAWQVAGFMGVQSAIFYSTVAWLPTMLQSRGMSELHAGYWVTGMQLAGCLASIVVPTLAGRAESQSRWVVACALLNSCGLLGLFLLPISSVGWAVLVLGVGLNASFGMALLLIALRSRTPEVAASLSSMAQAAGYLFAAPGPWVVGWLSTTGGGWPLAFGAVFILTLITMVLGYAAGRPGELDAP